MTSRGSGRKRVTKELSKEDAEREEAGSPVELGGWRPTEIKRESP